MWKCSKCGETHEENYDTCWNCGTSQEGEAPDEEFLNAAAERIDIDSQMIESNASEPVRIPLPPAPTYPLATRPISVLLSRYINQNIGINYEQPKKNWCCCSISGN